MMKNKNEEFLLKRRISSKMVTYKKNFIELFEEQVNESPESTAIISGNNMLTYLELNQRANIIAHHLKEYGVGRNSIIPIIMERSEDSICAILGILKARGSYIAIDPSLPIDRIRFILEDSLARVVLTNKNNLEKTNFFKGSFLLINDINFNSPDLNRDNLTISRHPQDLAYILYTSGSTGKPKGVMIQHDSLANYLIYARDHFFLRKGTVILHSSLAFDMSITSTLGPLIKGCTIKVAPFNLEPERLGEQIEGQDNLVLLKLTPSHLRALKYFPGIKNTINKIDCLIFGGENLLWEDVRDFINARSGVKYINEYGPTEATVGCCLYEITNNNSLTDYSVPIGASLSNTQLFILDQNLAPVEQGQIGEIYISGLGLARGYLNNPELTAEKFIPNPFATIKDIKCQKNLRLYRTGDIGRNLSDGNIEFIGRADDQIKIRGYRVELGEIEACLRGHGDIKDVCVISTKTDLGNLKIIAYLVPEEFEPTETELTNFMLKSLSDYMIPAEFIFLDHMPLNENGKIDRKSLPQPNITLELSQTIYESPTRDIEARLCNIWEKVFKVEKIGISDNFFKMGGDSIIAIQLVSRSREMNINFTVQDLFLNPTIKAIATSIKTQKQNTKTDNTYKEYYKEGSLAPIQSWFFSHNLENKNHFNQSILLKIRREIHLSHLNQMFSYLVSHHSALRYRYFQDKNMKWQQKCIDTIDTKVCARINLSTCSDSELENQIRTKSEIAQKGMSIHEGPVIKALLFDCGKNRPARLLIVIHHLMVDGVSWRILINDIEKLCLQIDNHQELCLPQNTSGYLDWVKSIENYAKSASFKQEIPYWQKLDSLEIHDFISLDIGPSSNRYSVVLSEIQTKELINKCPSAFDTQINDLLLSALLLSIGDILGQYSIKIALEGHGREEKIVSNIDLTRTVGWFTSMFPVNLSTSDPHDIEKVILRVKRILREIPNKGIGYGIYHYILDESSKALPQTMLSFNYLGQWDKSITSGGLFDFANESRGRESSALNKKLYPLEITGEIRENILRFTWDYYPEYYSRSTIKNLADQYIKRLSQIIELCAKREDNYTVALTSPANQEDISLVTRDISGIEDVYDLTPMQSGILFHSISSPKLDSYLVQTIIKLSGVVNSDILKAAFRNLVQKHAILRTGFLWKKLRKPFQFTLKSIKASYTFLDWSDSDPGTIEKKFNSFLYRDRKKRFDLSSPPLFRISLVKESSDHYRLVISFHHILLDGWSSALILRDLFKIYKHLRTHSTVKLQDTIPFSSYVTWLNDQDMVPAKEFWLNNLSSVSYCPSLSFEDLVHEGEIAFETLLINFSSRELQMLETYAKKLCVTLNTLLQGAIGLVLQAYTQHEEVIMGVTVSGRTANIQGAEEIVGLLINTLPLRIKSNNDSNIHNYLKNIQNDTQKINSFFYSPLFDIQSWTKMHRNLFDVIFIFERYPLGEEEFNQYNSEFKIEGYEDIENTEYPLTIAAVLRKDLKLVFNYRVDHFYGEVIESLSEAVKNTLLGFIENEQKKIKDISVLSSEERNEILHTLSIGPSINEDTNSILQMFEKQVLSSPENIALISGEDTLTYKLLNQKASQVAAYLTELNLCSQSFIGVACERSTYMIIAILGVLKVGRAYIPLDPKYPTERLKYMIEDTGCKVILTQSHLAQIFEGLGTTTIIMDKEQFSKFPPKISPDANVTNTNLAYVIYTSGTTGRPKGVLIDHGNLSSRFSHLQNSGILVSNDVVLQHTSLNFDVSVEEIFWPLITGGKIVLLPPSSYNHIKDLQQAIFINGVTFIQFVPSYLKLFLEYVDPDKCISLKHVFVGGEPLEKDLLREFREQLPNVKLSNVYGPTESTIDATIYDCTATENTNFTKYVPIGRPISNTSVYILDELLRPVPKGATGEIYIGGEGVAKGYLNLPDLTANKFIKNVFIQIHDKQSEFGNELKLYKSGDLGRFLPDGNIEFVSRIDHQIKIRGYRVELSEIEGRLNEHKQIGQAIVIAKENSKIGKQLYAYVTSKSTKEQEKQTLIAELQKYCELRLPHYMVPNFFKILDAFPFTVTGKIDREALHAFQDLDEYFVKGFEDPKTEVEKKLFEVWQDLIPGKTISRHDNFFKLGGHSLLGMQVISRLNKHYNVDFSLKAVFDFPTLTLLAKYIENKLNSEKGQEIQCIRKINQKAYIPLSFAQTRLLFLDKFLPEKGVYNIYTPLQMDGELDIIVFKKAINKVLNRHDILRSRLAETKSGKVYLKISPKANLTVNFNDLSDLSKDIQQQVSRFIKKEAKQSFDLFNSLPIRIRLLKISSLKHICIITVHHIAFDGWSFQILMRELSTFYNNIKGNKLSKLEDLPIQYHDFASWQRKWLKESVLSVQLDYWQTALKGIPEICTFPTDKARPKFLSYKGGCYKAKIKGDLLKKLKTLAQKNETTLFTLLLASFQILLHRYNQHDDILIGTPISNRNYPNVQNLIGMFVNTLVIRGNCRDSSSFNAYLSQIKEVLNSAYQNQDIPFEILVDKLIVSRNLNYHPLFQVMFSYESFEETIDNFDEINVCELPTDHFFAKFDLTLSSVEKNDHIELNFEFEKDLYKDVTIERLAQHYLNLLTSIIENTDLQLSQLEMLSIHEQERIITEFNSTSINYPANKTILELIQHQVIINPNAVAVSFKEHSLTYKELDARSSQIANQLLNRGVKRESIVAISMDRSLELIISLLGILKAGGAYVPIDPSYPEERKEFILNSAQSPVLITQSHIRARFTSFSGQTVIIDNLDEKLFYENLAEFNTELNCENIAYVIYTSGTTGKPKGVKNTHRGLLNRLQWMQAQYGIGPNDKILQKTPFSFDVSVWEFFWPLISGAQLVIAPPGIHREADKLVDVIQSEKITVIHFVPSMLSIFLDIEEARNCSSLRYVIVSGDALTFEVQQRFYTTLSAQLHNLYGPTEASIDVTFWPCVKDKKVLIGTPISNTKIYILDKYLNILPTGIPGELYIGGVGLARGYLNLSDLTADKFIPNPFFDDFDSTKRGERLYRTGDLCKWLSDGKIEYIGRNDHQIKLRGFRIELEEIEATLIQNASVKEAIVVAQTISDENMKLIAYIIVGHENLTTDNLIEYMKQKLPDYMVPNFYVFLEKFPFTTNGKVDRNALPKPNFDNHKKSNERPKSATEKKLCNIWKEILNINNIHTNDNFFDLGGHSILATRLIFAIKKEFDCKISLLEFFDEPTIKKLAYLLDTKLEPVSCKMMIENLTKDLKLASSITFNSSRIVSDEKKKGGIFLTGGSGFLGTHLLTELIKQTDSDIYCLVRGPTEKLAVEHFNKRLRLYLQDHLIGNKRIIPVLGDLTKPRLGILSDESLKNIYQEVDTIFHNGAQVHHLYDYTKLREANVLSINELLKLSNYGKQKKIHFISTLSSVLEKDKQGRILEEFSDKLPGGHEGGYSISKWAGEKVLHDASQRGFDISIHRLPLVIGHSQTGLCPSNNIHIMLLLKSCIQNGIAPDDSSYFNFLPVDIAAQWIIKTSEAYSTSKSVFNLVFPNAPTFNDIIDWVNEFGFKVDRIPYKKWQREYVSQMKEKDALFPLLPLYLSSDEDVYDTNLNQEGCVPHSQRAIKYIEEHVYNPNFKQKNLFMKSLYYLEDWLFNNDKAYKMEEQLE